MKHNHTPRIIGQTTRTYTKGTVVCSICGEMLKSPLHQIRKNIQTSIKPETI